MNNLSQDDQVVASGRRSHVRAMNCMYMSFLASVIVTIAFAVVALLKDSSEVYDTLLAISVFTMLILGALTALSVYQLSEYDRKFPQD